MRNHQRVHLFYFVSIFMCVILLYGMNRTVDTFNHHQKSKAATLDSNSSHEPLVIQKLINKKPVTIVAYGDSITWGYEKDALKGKVHQVKYPYPIVLEKELRKKYGYNKIKVINEGHPGWTSIQAVENIEKDVLSIHPDVVISMFGINDAKGHKKYSPNGLPVTVDQYRENMQHVIQKLHKKGIEVVIISPTTITSKKNNANKTQEHYTNAIKSLVKDENFHYINGTDIPIKDNLSDGTHFQPNQYRLIAEKIMQVIF